MRKLFLVFMAVLFIAVMASCSAAASIKKGEQSIGIELCDKSGDCFFCAYDEQESKEIVAGGQPADPLEEKSLTCSFTAKVGDQIYECDKLRLSSLDMKNFVLDQSCKIILDLKNENTQKSQSSAVTADFKTSGKVSMTQNPYASTYFETCGNESADWG